MARRRSTRLLRSTNARVLRPRGENMKSKYVNDLPAEVVQKLVKHRTNDRQTAPKPQATGKRRDDTRRSERKKFDKVPKTQVSKKKAIKAKIVAGLETAKKLRDERRQNWEAMEQLEERIAQHLEKVCQDDNVDERFKACEVLEKKIKRICGRLWDLGGALDKNAVNVAELLKEQIKAIE